MPDRSKTDSVSAECFYELWPKTRNSFFTLYHVIQVVNRLSEIKL